MNQEKRNKKNNNYQKNLTKRDNVTKSSLYLENVSDGILKSNKSFPPGMYEFVVTRSHGRNKSREKYVYKWSKVAIEAKEQCKKERIARLIPIEDKIQKSKIKPAIKDYSTLLEEHREKVKLMKTNKQVKLENLVFSTLHNNLISNLFGTENKLTKRMIEKDMHKFKLNKISKKLKETKEAIEARYNKTKNWYIKIIYKNEDDKLYTANEFYSNDKLKGIKDFANNMNKKLCAEDSNYHHISIIDNHAPNKDVLFIYKSEDALIEESFFTKVVPAA